MAGGEEGRTAVPTSDKGVQSPGQVPHLAHQGLVQGLGVPPGDSSTQDHPVPQLPGVYLEMIFLHTLPRCPPHTLLLCIRNVDSSIPLIAIHPLVTPKQKLGMSGVSFLFVISGLSFDFSFPISSLVLLPSAVALFALSFFC